MKRTARHRRILAAIEAHGRMNTSARWHGSLVGDDRPSPDSGDWHNIARICVCGVRVSQWPWRRADPKAERAAWLDHFADEIGRAAR